MDDIKNNIAVNIAECRKRLNLTQAQLAEKLNYSDKAVSKWERAEAVPDIYILSELAKIFGTTVDELISSEPHLPEQKQKPVFFFNKTIIALLSGVLVWVVATLCFVILEWCGVDFKNWLCFIYAIPATAIVEIVFNAIWGKRVGSILLVSALIWTLALSFFLTFPKTNIWLIFIICIPLQVLTILWLFLKRPKKETAANKNGESKKADKN